MSGRCDTSDPFAPLLAYVHIYSYFEVMLLDHFNIYMKENTHIIIGMVIQQEYVLEFPKMSKHNDKDCLLN